MSCDRKPWPVSRPARRYGHKPHLAELPTISHSRTLLLSSERLVLSRTNKQTNRTPPPHRVVEAPSSKRRQDARGHTRPKTWCPPTAIDLKPPARAQLKRPAIRALNDPQGIFPTIDLTRLPRYDTACELSKPQIIQVSILSAYETPCTEENAQSQGLVEAGARARGRGTMAGGVPLLPRRPIARE